MSSTIAHFVVGAGLALPAMESDAFRGVATRWAIPVTAGLLAAVPDLDTYAMIAFNIPRGTFFSHRGFFHSPFFLILLACLLAAIVLRDREFGGAFRWLALAWACAALSHPLMDMLTDRGFGVMLLFPFSSERLFFAWRPVHVSPANPSFFLLHAEHIFWSELPFCAVAVAAGLETRRMVAELRSRRWVHRGFKAFAEQRTVENYLSNRYSPDSDHGR